MDKKIDHLDLKSINNSIFRDLHNISSNVSTNGSITQENLMYKIDLDDLVMKYRELEKLYLLKKKECEQISKDREALKQQCSAAIRQWDKTLHENNDAKKQLFKTKLELDETYKKFNQEINSRNKVSKDLARLTEERNGILHEYNLIMSERDTVHKEIERLTEELHEAQKKLKIKEMERVAFSDEIDKLKREITNLTTNNRWNSTLFDGNQNYTKLSNSTLNYKNCQTNNNAIYYFKSKSNIESNNNFINSSNQNRFPNKFDSSEINCDSDVLRKKMLNFEQDFFNLQQDFFNMKKQRDNAFIERDKKIQEQESIKTLCDKLRREKDRAIRDKAEAISELGDMKQKIESNIEFKKYIDSLSEINISDSKYKNSIYNNNASKDSAISTDLPETEYQNLNIKLVNDFNYHSINNPWGFSIKNRDKNITVTSITIDSPADNVLMINDIIIKVNSIPVNDVILCDELIKKRNKELNLLIQRKKSAQSIQKINLNIAKNSLGHGLILETGFYISKILNDSAASKISCLFEGDRIISINGNYLDNCTLEEVIQILENENSKLTLQISKTNNTSFYNIYSNQQTCKDEYKYSHLSKEMVSSSSQTENLNINQYRSIKRLSKKCKDLSSDEFNSFFYEHEKMSPTLIDRAYKKIFGKKNKSKTDKKEDKYKKSFEKETLDALDQVLENFTKNNLKQIENKNLELVDKSICTKNNNGGTWPKCRPANPFSSSIYSKINGISTIYQKKKERKSLILFNNSNKNDLINKTTSHELTSSIPKTSHLTKNNQTQFSKLNRSFDRNFKSLNEYQDCKKDFTKNYLHVSQLSKVVSKSNIPVTEPSYCKLLSSQSYKQNDSSYTSFPSSFFSTFKENCSKSSNTSGTDQLKCVLNYNYINNKISEPFFNTNHSMQSKQKNFLNYKSSTSPEKQDHHKQLTKNLNIYEQSNINSLDSSTNNRFSSYLQSNFNNNDLSSEMQLYSQNQNLSISNSLQEKINNKYVNYSLTSNYQHDGQFLCNTTNNSESLRFSPQSLLNYSQSAVSRYNNEHADYSNNSLNNRELSNNTTEDNLSNIQTDSHTINYCPALFINESSSAEKKSSPINIQNKNKGFNCFINTTSPSTSINNDLISSSLPSSNFSILNTTNNFYNYNQNDIKKNLSNLNDVYTSNNLPIQESNSNSLLNNFTSNNSTENNYIHKQSNDGLSTHSINSQRIRISLNNNNINSKLSSNCSTDAVPNLINKQLYLSKNNSIDMTYSNYGVNKSNDSNFLSHFRLLNRPIQDEKSENYFISKKTNHQVNLVNSKLIKNCSKSNSSSVKSIEKQNKISKENNQNLIVENHISNKIINNQCTNEIRSIVIEKSSPNLGIQISTGLNKSTTKNLYPGIFVSSVNKDSLAEKVGLQVGDQLLEICGINMRSANFEAAANVLRQCGNTLNMKVQYNPAKFYGENESNCSNSNSEITSKNQSKTSLEVTVLDSNESVLEDFTPLETNKLSKKDEHCEDKNLKLNEKANLNLDENLILKSNLVRCNKQEAENIVPETLLKEDDHIDKYLYF